MKIDIDIMTKYLHRMRNQPGWAALNEVGTSVNMDRATSRRYTKTAEDWELIERQQLENQPTQIQATKKLMKLEPGEVRKIVQANCQEFDV
ncbi:MAG: transcriptional regulator [Microcoleaceae cyanobacterium]